MTGASARRLGWLAGLSALLLTSGTGSAAERDSPAVVASRLPGSGSAITWSAPQFIQADAKGRIFVLRGDTLDVYPINRSGAFGEPVKLRGAGAPGPEPLRAAMGSAGGDWVVYYGPAEQLRFFRGGKAELVPPCPWHVEAVGVAGGQPVANVLPFRVGRQQELRVPDPPPLLLAYDGSRWSTLRSERVTPQESGEPMMDAIVQRSAWLAGGADGKLLTSDLYRYRVRTFSAAGRLLHEIAVGPSEARPSADPKKAGELLMKTAGGRRLTEGKRGRAVALTARQVIAAAARGRDGTIYVLVNDESEGYSLDRYEPATAALERVALRLPGSRRLSTPTLAVGKDGLYLAAFRGNEGRFRISWEVLAEAAWKEVEQGQADAPEKG